MFKKSIKRTVTFIVGILFLIYSIEMIIFNVVLIDRSVNESLTTNAVETANRVATLLDTERYEALYNNPEENDDYWALREELYNIRETVGALYLYTMQLADDGEITFLVEGAPRNDEMAVPINGETPLDGEVPRDELMENGYWSTDIIETEFGSLFSTVVPFKNASGEVIGLIGVDMGADKVAAAKDSLLSSTLPVLIGTVIISIIFLSALLYYILNRSLKPLTIAQQAADEFAKGDLVQARDTLSGINLDKEDEVSMFAKSFDSAIHDLGGSFNNVRSLSQTVDGKANEALQSLESVKASNAVVSTSVEGMTVSGEQNNAMSKQSAHVLEEMVQGIQQMASSSNELASASQEMSTQVGVSVEEAQRVVHKIEKVEGVVIETAADVEAMGQQFAEIEQMVKVITDIADQTNLLALNAAIEAARAGESGKGFAVVADEVRKLAEMSRHSAENISTQLSHFSQKTTNVLAKMTTTTTEVRDGSEAVKEIGEKLEAVLEVVQHVNENIQNDSAVIEELSASSEQVLQTTNDSVRSIDNVVKETHGLQHVTEEQVRTLQQLDHVFNNLLSVSNDLDEEMKKFRT